MSGRPRWEEEGRDWPLREASRFVEAGWLRWHVQQLGAGPVALLLHGTGAATHSWRGVAPLLALHLTVIMPDLPGHGFTQGRARGGLTLPGMSRAVGELLEALGVRPALVVGHSAGVAVAVRMALDGRHSAPIVGFAPALTPFPGVAARLFPVIARTLFVNPFTAGLFARIARVPGEVERFLARATGSRVDARGVELYARLFGNSEHCAGAIEMMADWDLQTLAQALPRLPVPLHLVHGDADSAIPLASVERVPAASLEVLPALGHLAHEERPETAARIILRLAADHAILAREAAGG